MLRLDPGFPPVWRDATTLQFGADPVFVLDEPEGWQLRLIRELEHGIPDAALEPVAEAFGAPEGAAGAFVDHLARALRPPSPPALAVVLQVPEGFPTAHAAPVSAALRAAGAEVTEVQWHGAADEALPSCERVADGTVVVLLAHHLIEPRRAAALMSRDIAHLPLVFTAARAEIGPVVVPGATACLACVGAARCERDPAWPVIAAQLIGRNPPIVSEALAWEGGAVAAVLVRDQLIAGGLRLPHRVSLNEHSLHRSLQVVRPHAACLCRSPSGTATADDRADPATTRATAFAQPA